MELEFQVEYGRECVYLSLWEWSERRAGDGSLKGGKEPNWRLDEWLKKETVFSRVYKDDRELYMLKREDRERQRKTRRGHR